jgi:hypothetical protein
MMAYLDSAADDSLKRLQELSGVHGFGANGTKEAAVLTNLLVKHTNIHFPSATSENDIPKSSMERAERGHKHTR